MDETQLDGAMAPDTAVDGGNLPSAQAELTDSLSKFQLSEEFVEKNFKNGKLYGRFDSMEAVLNTLKAVEDKHANTVREIKNQEKASAEETVVKPSLPEAAQPVIAKFVDNGLSYEGMDSDIAQLAQETGYTPAEIKLYAIELKDQIAKAYNVVGGQEEYTAMLDWAKENLDDGKKAEFDKGLSTPMSEYAIKGLYADYKQATGDANYKAPDRIRGDSSAAVGVRPYGTFQELARDREYLASSRGRNDSAARELHNRRMSMTSDSVVFGR